VPSARTALCRIAMQHRSNCFAKPRAPVVRSLLRPTCKLHSTGASSRSIRAQVATERSYASVLGLGQRGKSLSPNVLRTALDWSAVCNGLQVVCVFAVFGVQLALLLERIQAHRSAVAAPRVQHSSQHFARQSIHLSATDPTPAWAPSNVAQYQPMLLALAMGAAVVAKLVRPKECAPGATSQLHRWDDPHCAAVLCVEPCCRLHLPTRSVAVMTAWNLCRKVHVEFSNSVGRKVMQSQQDLADVKAALGVLDRKFTKVQSRVLLCSEQLRALRRENTELRSVSNDALVQQGAALADVQEQADSLQKVLGSLQDVVVKQVKVRCQCRRLRMRMRLACIHQPTWLHMSTAEGSPFCASGLRTAVMCDTDGLLNAHSPALH
jgi:hypothetical protein